MMIRKLSTTMGVLGFAILLSGCASLSAGDVNAGRHANGGGQHGGMSGDSMMMNDGMMEGGHPHGEMHEGQMMSRMQSNQNMHCQMNDCEAQAAAAATVLQAYSAAINAEDIDAMAELVVADERFSVIEGRGTNIGWADYRDHHIGPEFASERIDFHSYGYDNIEVRVGHMYSYATFTYAFEATLDGEPYNKDGRGTAVLLHTHEGWRIMHLQTS